MALIMEHIDEYKLELHSYVGAIVDLKPLPSSLTYVFLYQEIPLVDVLHK